MYRPSALPKRAEHLELDPLAGVVLPDQLRAAELDPLPEARSGPVVHHWRLRSSVSNSAGSRDGMSPPEAAMLCRFSTTASSSVLRVPRRRFSLASAAEKLPL